MAPTLQRARRSGIGTYTFMYGGFIIDGGKTTDGGGTPSLLARLTFPSDWRVLLVMDRDKMGCHGSAESRAFAELDAGVPSFDGIELAQRVRDAVEQGQFEAFAQGIGQLQDFMGRSFAHAQGGKPYVSADVAAALHRLQEAGVRGCGQSSWGPTGFAFFKSAGEAKTAQRMLADISTIDTYVSAASEKGAIYT
ncbi:MAG: hypothetical protein GDA50_05565 [Alphaproteobacteria bacterium GM202ARS2]|nr:hypothetical protein [Alphaproteobacteria bacterium GM202ARS2]